ncbi:hypothetical protein R5R35_005190 [Gryllus longicercus]|uniref:C-type lectin domain-containing protein n=1 Tax=Gryllus longicercus TaxID=2509291 RepID=A0AAN9ZFX8_9ORTH
MLYTWCVLVAAVLSAWTVQAAVIGNGSAVGDAEAELLEQETRPQVPEGAQLCSGSGCEAGEAAELLLQSGLNASGRWLAKVRLQHMVGRPGENGDQRMQPPVQLQMRRSSRRGVGDSRLVTLQATLTGGSDSSQDPIPWTDVGSPCPACPTTQPNPEPQQSSCPPAQPCPPTSATPACPSTCSSPCPACPSCPAPQQCPPPVVISPPCPACPSRAKPTALGYERHEGHGAYRVHLTPLNWFDAQATCEREGAHLAVINSQEEADILQRMLSSKPTPHNYVLLGFHDLDYEGAYYTVLDTPLKSSGYLKWAEGEPNNKDDEDCGGMYVSNMQLNDQDCLDIVSPFICEMP